ncbi:MAG: hypothetical protein ACREN2_11505 [Candidatus Dormibacteria bacterium]
MPPRARRQTGRRLEVDSPTRTLHGVTGSQAARVLTGLVWITWAAWFTSQPVRPPWQVALVLFAAAGLALMGAALLVQSRDGQRRIDLLILGGTVALIVIAPVVAALGNYLTDELAYDQAAAAALLHGVNPYGTDLTSALSTFGVSVGQTIRLDGTPMPNLSYPSLSFLVYVPGVALLGATSYAGLLFDVLAWALAAWVMWRVVTPSLRPWVPLLFLFPATLEAVLGGMTDSLFVPLAIVAVARWDRFGDPSQRGPARWVGPVALGLACAFKQQPWFLAPLLVIGVAMEARARGAGWPRVAGGYALVAALAFLVPNLPFIVWNPGAWLSRVLTPFTSAMVPMGIGPATLLRALGIGGGNLSLFGLAAGAALIAALAAFVARYARLRTILPLLPLGVLFVSSRSFLSYFVFAVPVLVVNAASLRPAHGAPLKPLIQRTALGVSAASIAVCVAFTTAAVLVSPPLHIAVTTSAFSAGSLRIDARVDNATQNAVRASFFLASGPYYNQPLTRVAGPPVLKPGASAAYEFVTTETSVTPHAGDSFQLQAGTESPATISTSPSAVAGS